MYSKKFCCQDCKKEISDSRHMRCAICFGKKHSKRMKGDGNHFYIDGRTLRRYYCPDCGKEINKNTYLYGSKRCRSCCTKHLFFIGKLNVRGKKNPMHDVHKFGANAPAYIHGKAYLPYPVEWKHIRIIIKDYYKGKCQKCNKKGIHVHHIDYNKQNCKFTNLILLCCKHHSKTLGNRDYWYAYFTYIKNRRNKCFVS